eukprot:CAMPEP_0172715346 /NCGR_PEP_ID=MMETSP1074-20121228/67496_1 /TAXON_ID=2916 /ORGANISM="Ceratium fusus, Strain PA161109" /LENGTH=99 /DNA_ID=CAMNT_0013539919 /DNA_START=220 /DNA_END=516 /DNA_ORIENTATION=-
MTSISRSRKASKCSMLDTTQTAANAAAGSLQSAVAFHHQERDTNADEPPTTIMNHHHHEQQHAQEHEQTMDASPFLDFLWPPSETHMSHDKTIKRLVVW